MEISLRARCFSIPSIRMDMLPVVARTSPVDQHDTDARSLGSTTPLSDPLAPSGARSSSPRDAEPLGDLDATLVLKRRAEFIAAARDAAATDRATAAAAERDGGQGATNHLGRLLMTAPTIDQAKGILLGYYGIGAEEAFAFLRRWSSHSNIKLSRIAEELVTAASRSGDQPFAGVEEFLRTAPPHHHPHPHPHPQSPSPDRRRRPIADGREPDSTLTTSMVIDDD